jgi:hypothetical protein
MSIPTDLPGAAGPVGLPEIVIRVGRLEREVAEFKGRPQPPTNWIGAITGSMKDEPEFDEVLRLSRELREAERAAAKNGAQ